MKRSAFFISDSTGITAEMLGNSLLAQFEGIEFDVYTIPYIDTIKHAEVTVERIDRAALADQAPPIVFDTIVDKKIRAVIATSQGVLLDVFATFLAPLENALHCQPTSNVGKTHGLTTRMEYQHRIDAVHYALESDDGAVRTDYAKADLILLGVSRSGKTPTCLYLALQYGICTANYPLTEEDLDSNQLPRAVRSYRDKLVGLTIDAQRLSAIRMKRKPDSDYASVRRCEDEVRLAQALYKRYRVPMLNTTDASVEEIATRVMYRMGIERRVTGWY